jgi:hypothetical protein
MLIFDSGERQGVFQQGYRGIGRTGKFSVPLAVIGDNRKPTPIPPEKKQ